MLAVADSDVDNARATAADLSTDETHVAFGCDVTSEAEAERLFREVEAGLGPVSILVTCAGVLISHGVRRTGIADTTLADWRRTFDVNATGTFLMLREMLRRRRAEPVEHGRIITISSVAAHVGGFRGSAAYSASKGAVLTLTKTAAGEGADIGVTANCIAPGMVESRMLRQVVPSGQEGPAVFNVPAGRVGSPGEIGALASYLASPASEFMTGATLDINGGQHFR